MKMRNSILATLILVIIGFSAQAERYKYEQTQRKRNDSPTPAANCSPATAAAELNINNTKALIQSGGDMWWDFNRSRYEIPSGSGKTSLFAGSLWLAGQDVSGQYKVAALRFRQIGNDYWTGPLSTVDAEIDAATCHAYDKHWETTRAMVAQFAAYKAAGRFDAVNGTTTQKDDYPGYIEPEAIKSWPAHGRDGDPYNEDYYLAPFHDQNGDGVYKYEDGDYPGYVLTGKSDCSRRVRDIYGDQNIWWVFNDKGNIHSESGGQSIGMEIRAQAFAFATTDEVNNMTFYNYELINRSTFYLSDTYFGQWVDGDLGNANDDFVGCDVQRGLGYFFNGDDDDEDGGGNTGYGTNPPAIGVDFFQGPFQANDNRDNCLCEKDYAGAISEDGIIYKGQGAGYGDGIVDNERYGMRKFLYHVNAQSPIGDPNIATDYYNMLRGIWRDGTPMTYGGSGYNPTDPNAIPAHYMFPGDSDPFHWGTDGVDPGGVPWTETSAGNKKGDRRFVQSSGPFSLGPGAVNNITVGVVWMKANSGGPLQSVADMKRADDKTQALFDSCFEILDGPHAPDVTVQELDREVILMLSNPLNSNNYQEKYTTVDPFLAAPDSIDIDGDDTLDVALTKKEKELYGTYTFEGYRIYQLANQSVGTNDLDDLDKARLIEQVDIANDVTILKNYVYNSQINADVPAQKTLEVNKGIKHSFNIKEDLFSKGDVRLINHKTYYYMVIAYAYNQYGDGFGNLQYVDGVYDPSATPPRLEGQKLPYLPSRTSSSGAVRVYEAIPHKIELEQNGIELNSQYGDGVEITRIEGRGNGGNFATIKEDYLDSAVTENFLVRAKYEAGKGPVSIKVVDPLMVQPGTFTLAFKDTTKTGDLTKMYWVLSGDSIKEISSDQSIRQANEQVIAELGISISAEYGYPATVKIPTPSGELKSATNGYIGYEIVYDDPTDQWLTGIVDNDANPIFNWIKSGTTLAPAALSGTLDNTKCDVTDDFIKLSSTSEPGAFLDPKQDWENIAGRTWCPFSLASYDTAHPIPLFVSATGPQVALSEKILKLSGLRNTPSVDVVLTTDKEKWTRCAVLEAGEVAVLSKGKVTRGELRRGLSVDKSGRNQLDPDFDASEGTMGGKQVLGNRISELKDTDIEYFKSLGFTTPESLKAISYGMGWFPGYAIDIETGERLNIAFSEDSWLGNENGSDMMWNPTSRIVEDLFQELRFGGKHMIYVFRHNTEDADILTDDLLMPAYDEGQFFYDKLIGFDPREITQLLDPLNKYNQNYLAVMRAGAWTGYPLLAENSKLFGENGDSKNEALHNGVTIRLRSTQGYRPYAVGTGIDLTASGSSLTIGKSYYVQNGKVSVTQTQPDGTIVSKIFAAGGVFKAESTSYTLTTTKANLIETINGALPLYHFNMDELAPTKSTSIGMEFLDEIKAVPNPYYAYSSYETNRLDYVVKIINLPPKCTVNIFTVNGVLVRTYNKDDASISSIDWDLKNQSRITVASGIYIIHVNVPDLGEKVIKWFGVLRPIDLNSF